MLTQTGAYDIIRELYRKIRQSIMTDKAADIHLLFYPLFFGGKNEK